MKRVAKVLPLALAGMMLSTFGFADSQHRFGMTPKPCYEIEEDIQQLIAANLASPCAGDLDVVAAYLNVAQMSLNHHKAKQALKSVDDAIRDLREISFARTYCEPLAVHTKQYLSELIFTRGEIEGQMKISGE